MSGINGVHALLAFLTQQAQSSKPNDKQGIDVRQLELLLQESRLLNERLLKIESLLSIPRTKEKSVGVGDTDTTQKIEGNWPAASKVRDIINRQERQQAFGNWQTENTSAVDKEPYSYHEMDAEQQLNAEARQFLIERYAPTEIEQAIANQGLYLGSGRTDLGPIGSGEKDTEEDSGRVLLVSIGISLLLLAIFAMIS